MTTAAMILGMLPMAFSLGAGSEFRSPMAVVVIGGLITSTGLTLIVVPVVYTLADDLKVVSIRFWQKVVEGKSLASGPPPPIESPAELPSGSSPG
jgi:HAE1 family hydrophobic/amphiphilic exporter-1